MKIKTKNPFIVAHCCSICGRPMEKITEEKNGAWGNTRIRTYFQCSQCSDNKGTGSSTSLISN
ncbi:hypothetical protein K8R61_01570 [bacterium]|nr:hypothetical protein [bacterium]